MLIITTILFFVLCFLTHGGKKHIKSIGIFWIAVIIPLSYGTDIYLSTKYFCSTSMKLSDVIIMTVTFTIFLWLYLIISNYIYKGEGRK